MARYPLVIIDSDPTYKALLDEGDNAFAAIKEKANPIIEKLFDLKKEIDGEFKTAKDTFWEKIEDQLLADNKLPSGYVRQFKNDGVPKEERWFLSKSNGVIAALDPSERKAVFETRDDDDVDDPKAFAIKMDDMPPALRDFINSQLAKS